MKSWIFSKLKGFAPQFFFSRAVGEILLTHVRPRDFMDHWSVQPFNGQIIRHKTISKIIEDFEPTACIETGTYLGSSTPYLAAYSNAPTYTIEIDNSTYEKAKNRHASNFKGLNIVNILGDSAIEIEKVLSKMDPRSDKVLAYLDAHWLDAIPTKAELNNLIAWGGEWIAIIDDFHVPLDSGYSFDQYGDVIIGKSQVPQSPNVRTFSPAVDSNLETGAKRGTGYIFFGDSLSRLSESTRGLICEI